MNAVQPYHPINDAKRRALKSSIARRGCVSPVVKNQHGVIIDGHMRHEICEELGVEYETKTVDTVDDADAWNLAVEMNRDRRGGLDPEIRREEALAMSEEGHTQRAIAEALGVGRSTVNRDLKRLDVPPMGQSNSSGDASASDDAAGAEAHRRKSPTRLTAEQKRQMIEDRRNGISVEDIAKRFGIKRNTVYKATSASRSPSEHKKQAKSNAQQAFEIAGRAAGLTAALQRLEPRYTPPEAAQELADAISELHKATRALQRNITKHQEQEPGHDET